jgi:cytochrome c553
MRLFWICLFSIAILYGPSSGHADPRAERGAALANACAACHGPEGRSQGAIPSLDGLTSDEFIAALKAFRAATRTGTIMNRIARGLDDTDIAAVAAYFVALPKR